MPAPDGRFTPTWTRHLVGGAALFGIATIVFPMGWADPADWPPELQAAWLVSLPSADVIAQAMRRRGAVP
ncbi:MAG: hypothetical protein OEM39_03630, partial [Acidimicrobiia bacterium]|nr:hypothetical protein [Acidimicrobiia bacterium]